MRVHVLFDAAGTVAAVFHPSAETGAPTLAFHPAAGQRTARLEIPKTLVHMTPRALHAAVEVSLGEDGPRLVARAQRPRSSEV